MVKRLRVLITNPPKLMRQLLVEMLKEESWIEIVGEATQESDIRELVQKTAPDLVVVTADRPARQSAICDELLSEFLALRLIAVTPHENYAVSHWASREINADEIESSERGFLGAMRKAHKWRPVGARFIERWHDDCLVSGKGMTGKGKFECLRPSVPSSS